jgi:5-(carboxyamino)imidazole ribonucleotide synthase
LERFLDLVDVVTVEFENIPDACLAGVEARRPLRPSRRAVFTTQHREREKSFLRDHGIACAPFRIVDDLPGLERAVAELGRPCVVKTAAFGYDGKGQAKVESGSDLAAVWRDFEGQRAVVEAWVPFQMEVSVVGARAVSGSSMIHGVMENQHRNHILDVTIAPARVSEPVAAQAVECWRKVAESLDYVGTLAVEMFVTADGAVMVNEIAPRPHNSGHLTIDACFASQFMQQARAVCGYDPAEGALARPAVMINLLGDVWLDETTPPDWGLVMRHPQARLHLYGKSTARAGRKMGHITVTAARLEEALAVADEIRRDLGLPPVE